MSGAVETLSRKHWVLTTPGQWLLAKDTFWVLLLTGLVMLSAMGVVYAKERHRQLFTEAQMLNQSRDSLQEQWGKLLLEEAVWSSQARIQGVATYRLSMQLPKVDQSVRINL